MTKSLTLLLLIAIALLQSVRISSTTAEETAIPRANASAKDGYHVGNIDVRLFTAEHLENLAMAGLLPYRIDPPDVVSIRLISKDSQGVTTSATDEFVVGPEGTIKHDVVAELVVAGKTADEVKRLIESKLRANGDDRLVELNVTCHNSKVFYVVDELSSDVARVPCTTDSNVRAAIESLRLEVPLADRRMWVSRPSGDGKADRAFPIKWNELSSDMKSPNYFPLFPSDRIFIDDGRELQVAVSVDEPSIPVPYDAAKHPSIRLNIRIISDEHGNLAEFKDLMQENRTMVANTLTTQATLRILEKNNLTSTLAMPSITCYSGQPATLGIDDFFEIETVASITGDAKMRVEASVKMDVQDKTKKATQTAVEMAANEMALLKAGDTFYLAITSEVLP